MVSSIPRNVSLSGKTRLTFREAYALLEAANFGACDMESDSERFPRALLTSLERAIHKLKTAIDANGGYDENGNLANPFRGWNG